MTAMAMVSNVREFRGLMEISLDGVLWLRVRKKHFALCPLVEGEDVDPESYIDTLAALQATDCYEAALTMLDRAAQARGELRLKLVRKGYVAPAAEAVAARLEENRLVDDARYAQRMAQAQLNKSAGVYAVQRKLRAKRLPEEAIEAAMEDFDEAQQAQACLDAAQKLWRKYAALPAREARAKLSQALVRRGFAWESIRAAAERIAGDSDDDYSL